MFRWYMKGGYKSDAGGNKKHGYTSWQQAVVTGQKGGSGLPGGPSGGNWGDGGQWGSAKAALAAIDRWINAPPEVAPCRPFDWKPVATA